MHLRRHSVRLASLKLDHVESHLVRTTCFCVPWYGVVVIDKERRDVSLLVIRVIELQVKMMQASLQPHLDFTLELGRLPP
jgi:hypothetical protein